MKKHVRILLAMFQPLPKQAKILFLDDQHHTLMHHKNIRISKIISLQFTYILPNVMINRNFLHSDYRKNNS